jgi:hypothetical protein
MYLMLGTQVIRKLLQLSRDNIIGRELLAQVVDKVGFFLRK